MKTSHRHASRATAFTLLEVIIVLAITAMVLGAVYSLAQGTLTLADDVRRAERRDARTQAFSTFCEHLLAELPPTAVLNVKVTQKGGQYLTQLELDHVRSPFDETPDCRVALHAEAQPGGGLRLMLTCKSEGRESSVVLFEDLAGYEWSAFHPGTRQWASFWTEENPSGVQMVQLHPTLLKLLMTQAGGQIQEQVFWVTPMAAVTQTTR